MSDAGQHAYFHPNNSNHLFDRPVIPRLCGDECHESSIVKRHMDQKNVSNAVLFLRSMEVKQRKHDDGMKPKTGKRLSIGAEAHLLRKRIYQYRPTKWTK